MSSKVFEDLWVSCLQKSNVTSEMLDDETSRGAGMSWSEIGRVSWVSSRVFDAV